MERCRLRANYTTLSVTTTLEIGGGHVLNWSVTLDLAGNTLGSRARVRVLIRLVESICLVANGGIVDIAVTSDGCGKGESSSNVLHCEGIEKCTTRRMNLLMSEETNEYKLTKAQEETNECDAPVLSNLKCRNRLRKAAIFIVLTFLFQKSRQCCTPRCLKLS